MLVRCGICLDEVGSLKVGRRKNVRLHGKSRPEDDVQAVKRQRLTAVEEPAPQTPVTVQAAVDGSAEAQQRPAAVRSVGSRTPAVQTPAAVQAVEERMHNRATWRWSIGATAGITDETIRQVADCGVAAAFSQRLHEQVSARPVLDLDTVLCDKNTLCMLLHSSRRHGPCSVERGLQRRPARMQIDAVLAAVAGVVQLGVECGIGWACTDVA